jgi:phosphoribosyl 1,2-cyclic phosphodiesterase
MRICFWGTRGSLPAPLSALAVRAKVREALRAAVGLHLDSDAKLDSFLDHDLGFAAAGTFGGNTSCVQIDTGGGEFVICDMGSGFREFGNHVLRTSGPAVKHVFHVFLTHLHWDHIMGLPFFVPAYIPGNVIRVYGGHDTSTVRDALLRQQSGPCFPVDFRQLGARFEFVQLLPGTATEAAGLTVHTLKQRHAGDSYGFRFEGQGKTVVYSTDFEHKYEKLTDKYPAIALFRDADLVIFDAMYSLADAVSVKEDWGHSSNISGVELCHQAGARHLCLFHHEPSSGDVTLARIGADTARFAELSREEGRAPLRVSVAYDGLELRLDD